MRFELCQSPFHSSLDIIDAGNNKANKFDNDTAHFRDVLTLLCNAAHPYPIPLRLARLVGKFRKTYNKADTFYWVSHFLNFSLIVLRNALPTALEKYLWQLESNLWLGTFVIALLTIEYWYN